MSTQTTWRSELAKKTRKQGQLVTVANQLGVKPRTLKRWIDHTSNPQWGEIKIIIKVFPDLAPLIFQEFLHEGQAVPSESHPANGSPAAPENVLPASLYAEIMRIVTSQPDYYQIISKKLLHAALQMLDHDQAGVKIVIAICMPPDDQIPVVQSLLVRVELATPPFDPITLREPNFFLGAESLAGSAVLKQRWEAQGPYRLLPLELFPAGTNVVALPLQRWGQGIAGCLLFGSKGQLPISILQQFTNVFGLMFPDHYFFSPEHIDLQILPSWTIQRSHYANFQDRVEKMRQTKRIHVAAAEGAVRKQIESELIINETART